MDEELYDIIEDAISWGILLEAKIRETTKYILLKYHQSEAAIRADERKKIRKWLLDNSMEVDLTVSKAGEWSNTSKGSGKVYRLISPDGYDLIVKLQKGEEAE